DHSRGIRLAVLNLEKAVVLVAAAVCEEATGLMDKPQEFASLMDHAAPFPSRTRSFQPAVQRNGLLGRLGQKERFDLPGKGEPLAKREHAWPGNAVSLQPEKEAGLPQFRRSRPPTAQP